MRCSTLAAALAALAAAGCQRAAPSPAATRPLRVLMGGNLRTLDPQASWDEVSAAIVSNVFDSLVQFDRSLRLTSGLALRWINPDETTWRFFLDPQARFHDGSPLRAADVAFSIERQRSLPGSERQVFAQHIARVDVVDELTVDIKTDSPVSILNSLAFIPILSRRQTEALAAAGGGIPAGTGRYRVAAWERGRFVRLEASEHHAAPPQIRRVEFMIRTDELTADDVARLDPDLALFLRLAILDELRRAKPAGLRVVASNGRAVFYVTLNVRRRVPGQARPNPLADVRVRRALALAIDRSEIVRAGLRGFGSPAFQLIVPEVFGFDPGIPAQPYDPARARALLAEAGQAGLELRLSTDRDSPGWLERRLVEQWSRAGVRTSVVELDADVLGAALEAGAFSAAVQGYSCTSADASEILSFILRSRSARDGSGVGNYSGYGSPEVDRLADQNLHVFDPRERLKMLQRALRLAVEDLPYVPLYSLQDVFVVSDELEWQPSLSEEIRLHEARFRQPSS